MSDFLVVFLITIIIFIIFLASFFFLLGRQGSQKREAAQPPPRCEVDQCATNLITGAKQCPPSGQTISFQEGLEVCNGTYLCDNPLTPLALQSDGSTASNGQCESGVACPCLRQQQCPSYIVSVFTSTNGNPYADVNGQRINFPQVLGQPPIVVSNPATTFCTVPASWLSWATPGCPYGSNPTTQDVVNCMGLISGCNNLQSPSSPCLNGTLAIISTPENFPDSINHAILGCVAGSPCPCGYLALYDPDYRQIICIAETGS